MLGTNRKNKSELTEEIPNKKIYSSLFYFTDGTIVVNYIPKKNKNVILMSTLHDDKDISKKPQMVLDYNATRMY